MKILLIDNYDSFTYNLYHYISKFRKKVDVVRNDKIDAREILRKDTIKLYLQARKSQPGRELFKNCSTGT